MRITTSGVASPGLGGFYQSLTSRANAVYIHRIIAKIPVGYTINFTSNAVGTGTTRYWITPQAGTGNWKEYAFIMKTGSTGTFSTFGHIYLTGTAPVTWDVAYSTIIDTAKKGTTGNIMFRTTDSGSGYTHYGINTSSTTQPTYTAVTNSSDLGVVVPGFTSNGTYYIWVKDAVGNVSNKAVSITAIDTTPPTCSVAKSNTGTTAVGTHYLHVCAVDAVGRITKNYGTYTIYSPVAAPTVTYSVAATDSSYLRVDEYAVIVPKCTSTEAISSFSVTVSGFQYADATHKVDGSSADNKVKKSLVTLKGYWDESDQNYTITTSCKNSGGTTTVTKNYTTARRQNVSLQVFTADWGSTIAGVTTVTASATDVTFSIRSRVVIQDGVNTLTRSCLVARTYGQRTTCDPQTSTRDVTFNPETQATCGRTISTATPAPPCK